MKKCILLLFLVLPLLLSAQSADRFVFSNVDSVKMFADSMALNAKRKFVFEDAGIKKNTNLYVVSYFSTMQNGRLNVVFDRYNIGENKDLEIEGNPEYVFSLVEGKFLDLFPFWKKYFDDKADANELSVLSYKFVKKTFKRGNGEIYTYSFSLDYTTQKWIIRRK